MPRSSRNKICVACKESELLDITDTESTITPTWLTPINYVTKFKKRTKAKAYVQTPKPPVLTKIDISRLLQNLDYRPKFVLVWASNRTKFNRADTIVDAKRAYGQFQNHQVIRLVDNGDRCLRIHLHCPQPYTAKTSKNAPAVAYSRHLHFCFSKSDGSWSKKNYTKLVYCNIITEPFKKLQRLVRNKRAIMINALPHEYHAISHIPNSVNLPHTTQFTKDELQEWFGKVITKNHYSNAMIKRIHEVPIIVYCAHSKCDAGHILSHFLMNHGYVNVFHYVGGMKEYENQNKRRLRT